MVSGHVGDALPRLVLLLHQLVSGRPLSTFVIRIEMMIVMVFSDDDCYKTIVILKTVTDDKLTGRQ